MDVMTRAVATVPPHLALNEALALMDDPRAYLKLSPTARHPASVVAASAMLRHMGKRRDWQSSAVEQIMSRDPCTIAPTAALEAAARLWPVRITVPAGCRC
jgi:CBS domain-containing protein